MTVDQLIYSDVWVSLGTYQFNSGSGGYLHLIDQTGEKYLTTMIGFDAAEWVARIAEDLGGKRSPTGAAQELGCSGSVTIAAAPLS